MRTQPDLPSTYTGEAIVAFVRTQRLFVLPRGLRRGLGPTVVVAERIVDSPVGPYLTLRIGEPVRRGFTWGYHFGLSVVDSGDARRSGRERWGYPHELGTLVWINENGEFGLRWTEAEFTIRARPRTTSFPLLLPLRIFQRRIDGLVTAGANLRGLARAATVRLGQSPEEQEERLGDKLPRANTESTVPADGAGVIRPELSSLQGTHRGLWLSSAVIRQRPARPSGGVFAGLRPARRSPEPGVIGMGDR